MSFGESVFSAGFIQKTIKGNLFVKGKFRVPPRNQHGNTLEHSRSHITEVRGKGMTCEVAQPHVVRPPRGPPVSLVAMSVSHRLLGCIYAVL